MKKTETEVVKIRSTNDVNKGVAIGTISLVLIIIAAFFLTHDPKEARKKRPTVLAVSIVHNDTLVLNHENNTSHGQEEHEIEELKAGVPVYVARDDTGQVHSWELWCRFGHCRDTAKHEQAVVVGLIY